MNLEYVIVQMWRRISSEKQNGVSNERNN